MSYQPNSQDAISAYMSAAADQYNVPLNTIDQPSIYSVDFGHDSEQTARSTYYIKNLKERDDQGRYPYLAVCTYHKDSNLWKVKLHTGETLTVRKEDERFIVAKEKE